MRLPSMLAPLCVLSLTYAFPIGNATAGLDARWYSVPSSNSELGPWPITVTDPINGNQQPIRFCYAEQNTADTIPRLLDAAIEKWRSAIDSTALDIILDPRLRQ